MESIMSKRNTQQKQSLPQISIIKRPVVTNQQKVASVKYINASYETRPTLPSVVSQSVLPHSEPKNSLPLITTNETRKAHARAICPSEISSYQSKDALSKTKKSSSGFKQWYNKLTSKGKLWFKILVVVGVLLLVCAAIILPVVFLIILSPSSITTTTTIASIVTSASWSFDQTTADAYGVYNGVFINGASYTANSSTQPYIGNGRALNLTAGANQSFLVSSPFFNLKYISFTIEAWIYPTDTTSDRGIFSQCACATCSNQCFYFILRSGTLYADFNFNGIMGSTTLSPLNWYHVAFVYNYATQQRILYVNGIQDKIASNINPYQGANGSIEIGAAQVSFSRFYFVGLIDSVQITTRAKLATEILFDASVIAYYSFDISSQNNDSGPNGLNGLSSNIAFVQGRVNQAMRFYGTSSYFRAYGFYQFCYSIIGAPFSISLWISPSTFVSGAMIQLISNSSSPSCFNLMGITTSTGTVGQLMLQGYGGPWPIMYGPYLSLNTWTHVSLTCSSTNGIIVYVNGIRYGSTGAFGPLGSNYIIWFQIGYTSGCSGNVPNGPFQGSVDEVYAHNRELTQADVTALANP